MSPRVPQQVDIFGDLHDIGPKHERMRLFEPAPAQLAGQEYLDLAADSSSPSDRPITAVHTTTEGE